METLRGKSGKIMIIFILKLKLSPKKQMFLEIHFYTYTSANFDFLTKYNFLT